MSSVSTSNGQAPTTSRSLAGRKFSFASIALLGFVALVFWGVARVFALVPTVANIQSPLSGSISATGVITFIATGSEAASTGTIKSGTIVLLTGVFDASSVFSGSATLTDGTYVVTVYSENGSGITTGGSSTFTVDTTAPTAPTITSHATGALTTDTTPTFSGAGESSSIFSLTLSGTTYTGVTTSTGWSYTSAALTDNRYAITVLLTDAAGNASASTGIAFTLDSTLPTVPTITSHATGALFTGTTPTFSGAGESGTIYSLTLSGTTYTGIVTTTGWSRTAPALSDNRYAITVLLTDTAGNASASTGIAFTLDSTLPTAPTITSHATGALFTGATPTFAGSGEAGTIYSLALSGTTYTGVTTTTGWSYTSAALTDNTYAITVLLTDAAGNVSASTGIAFTLDSTVPTTPTITSHATGALITDTTPTFSGAGENGTVFSLALSGTTYTGVTTTTGWSYTPSALTDNRYAITVLLTDTAGNASSTTGIAFTLDTTAPTVPTITSHVTGALINDNTPTFTGAGESGTIYNLTLGGTTYTGVVTSVGWSKTMSTLTDRLYTGSITLTDTATNVSSATGWTFTLDATAPTAPTISSPTAAERIVATSVTLAGTGEADSVYTATLGGTTYTGTVSSLGVWTFTNSSLTNNDYILSITLTDTATNVSSASTVSFTFLRTPGGSSVGGGSVGGGSPVAAVASNNSAKLTAVIATIDQKWLTWNDSRIQATLKVLVSLNTKIQSRDKASVALKAFIKSVVDALVLKYGK